MSESKIINAADEYSRRIKDEKKTELLDGDYKEQIGNKNLEKDLNKTRSIFVDHPDNKTQSQYKRINAAEIYSRKVEKVELSNGDYKEQIGNKNLEKDLNKTRSIFVDHPDNKTEPQYKRINAAEIYSRRISKEENESIFEESYREGIGNKSQTADLRKSRTKFTEEQKRDNVANEVRSKDTGDNNLLNIENSKSDEQSHSGNILSKNYEYKEDIRKNSTDEYRNIKAKKEYSSPTKYKSKYTRTVFKGDTNSESETSTEFHPKNTKTRFKSDRDNSNQRISKKNKIKKSNRGRSKRRRRKPRVVRRATKSVTFATRSAGKTIKSEIVLTEKLIGKAKFEDMIKDMTFTSVKLIIKSFIIAFRMVMMAIKQIILFLLPGFIVLMVVFMFMFYIIFFSDLKSYFGM